jgi:cytidylate kinase
MKRLDAIDRYLAAQAAAMRTTEDNELPDVRPFVTISRQVGAGGHRLAEALLEAFDREEDRTLFGGWEVFDRKLCELVAEHPSYEKSMNSLLSEEYRTKTDEFFQQIFGSAINQDVLIHHVFRVVNAVASLGKSIIVGRAGSEATRRLGPRVALRLVAPVDLRIERVREFYGLEERAARNEASRLDGYRARLLKRQFKVDIDDPLLYDATWNTAEAPIEGIADSVVALLRYKAEAAGHSR